MLLTGNIESTLWLDSSKNYTPSPFFAFFITLFSAIFFKQRKGVYTFLPKNTLKPKKYLKELKIT